MAIALDATSIGTYANPATSITFSHTCTGSDRILFVGVMGGYNATPPDNITGVTYNGVSMTLVNKVSNTPSGRYSYLFYLIAPATGANNIVVSSNISTDMAAGGVSYTGAKQTGQPDANTTNTAANANTLTTTLTTIADNCWTVLGSHVGGGTPAAGTGSTSRTNTTGWGMFDSNGAITPAGSTSMIINTTDTPTTHPIQTNMASFAPAIATSNNGAAFLMMMA